MVRPEGKLARCQLLWDQQPRVTRGGWVNSVGPRLHCRHLWEDQQWKVNNCTAVYPQANSADFDVVVLNCIALCCVKLCCFVFSSAWFGWGLNYAVCVFFLLQTQRLKCCQPPCRLVHRETTWGFRCHLKLWLRLEHYTLFYEITNAVMTCDQGLTWGHQSSASGSHAGDLKWQRKTDREREAEKHIVPKWTRTDNIENSFPCAVGFFKQKC